MGPPTDSGAYDIRAMLHGGPTAGPFRPSLEDVADHQYVRAHNNLAKMYRRFCSEYDIRCESDRPFDPPPDQSYVYAFMAWLPTWKQGRIAQKISLSTVTTAAKVFLRIVRDQTGFEYDRRFRRELLQWCRKGLVRRQGVSTRCRPKPLANKPVVIDLLHFLWASDEKEFFHPRTRLQISLSMLIMLFLGLRPGEFVESSAHRKSNEGIVYKDLTLLRVVEEGGRHRFAALLRLRYRKFNRHDESKDYTMCLVEDDTSPETCPLLQLLALAIADNALVGVQSATDLEKVRVLPGQFSRLIPIRPSRAETPIFRRTTTSGSISDDGILTATTLAKHLQQLGERAGYQDRLTPYAFRRGHGNVLDRYVSAAQRRRQFGHKSDESFLSYISTTSGIDTQSIMHGREPDQALLDFVQSMKLRLQHAEAPPAELESAETPSNDSEADRDASDLHLPYTTELFRKPASRLLTNHFRYDTARANLVNIFYGRTSGGPSLTLSQMVQALCPLANTVSPPIWRYPEAGPAADGSCPFCGKIGRTDHPEAFNQHLLQCRKKAKFDSLLLAIAQLACTRYEACRWEGCSQPLRDMDAASIAAHIGKHSRSSSICQWDKCQFTGPKSALKAHLRDHHGIFLQCALPERMEYCFECSEYFSAPAEWKDHCEEHLRTVEMSCGRIARRHVLLSGYKCSFCLGDKGIVATKRYKQFAAGSTYNRHMARHLEAQDWPARCPHPLCNICLADSQHFWQHSSRDHQIAGPRSGSTATSASKNTGVDDDMDDDDDAAGIGSTSDLDDTLPVEAAWHPEARSDNNNPEDEASDSELECLDASDTALAELVDVPHAMIADAAACSTAREVAGLAIDPQLTISSETACGSHESMSSISGAARSSTPGVAGLAFDAHFALRPEQVLDSHESPHAREAVRSTSPDVELAADPSSPSVVAARFESPRDMPDFQPLQIPHAADDPFPMDFSSTATVGLEQPTLLCEGGSTPLNTTLSRSLNGGKPWTSQPSPTTPLPAPAEQDEAGGTAGGRARKHRFKCYWRSPDTGLVCTRLLRDAHQLNKHHESHTKRERLTCPYADCRDKGKLFLKAETLQRHIDVLHRRIKPYWCSACPATFQTPWRRQQHVRERHADTLSG